MPELPEVETVRRTLDEALRGREILGVAAITWPRTIAAPAVDMFCGVLCNRQIWGVRRRAKYIIIDLDNEDALVVHLRMTGRLLVVPEDEPLDPYTRVVLILNGGEHLRFRDVRKFGRIWLLDRAGLEQLDRQLGPEPLDPGFTAEALVNLLRGRQARLKPLLLDQRLIAGLGNIYADEALWRAGLHPLQTAGELNDEEVARLHAAITAVLADAVARRGTTLSDYRDALGEMGENQHYLAVYGRQGQPCPRCGTPVERVVVAQRGTHFCPHCQPLSSS